MLYSNMENASFLKYVIVKFQNACNLGIKSQESSLQRDNMLEHYDKTIAILPYDLILGIFSDPCLGIREHLIISLVCNLWARLSSHNTVWQALFLRKFSWSPALFYTHASIRESYKQQLSLNVNFEEKCKPNHQCSVEPGLIAAIRESNLARIEALLHSGHGIFVSSQQNVGGFFDEYLQVLSESTNLPPVLLKKIFENGIVDENMERYGINGFHILCLKGNQALLDKIFTLLGDDLLEISRYADSDGVDLFSHLLNYPFYEDNPVAYADVQIGEETNRLGLILETFYNVLGKTRMRSLLITPFFESGHESFIHVLANYISYPKGNQHFFKAFSYLEREDYWILLAEGSNYFDIPLFKLIHCPQSFKRLVRSLEDDAPRFLMHKNCHGYSFLYFLLCNGKFSSIPLLEEVMGLDFIDFLVMKDSNENMLKKILGTRVTKVKDMIIQVLKLMKDYDCTDIIQELHGSPEFFDIVNKNCLLDANEISDIFIEYLDEETYSCTLL
ncbi:F-box protein [Fluoribacter gormanii]|uniref:F-box-like domain-containing protein n=1 Tax=Fluoribacter gormanii TaxID=464 RepID=UPI0022445C50|nr:F-box-like domain-containing protein [Fluoribacter gormanii]MCW8445409.1 F-box protein [Fluoribacter gormanii]